MADALGPDPTRDPLATRDAIRDVFLAGARLAGDSDNRLEAFDAWYAKEFPPPLPPEPPEGAVCRGQGTDLWHRNDIGNGYGTWWLNGNSHRYGEALDAGMMPNRRLVELPDPNDRDAVIAIENAIEDIKRSGASYYEDAQWYLAAVRALTERGQP